MLSKLLHLRPLLSLPAKASAALAAAGITLSPSAQAPMSSLSSASNSNRNGNTSTINNNCNPIPSTNNNNNNINISNNQRLLSTATTNASFAMEDLALNNFKRHYIDQLRKKIESVNCKTPQEQDITLEKDEQTKLAKICLRSGAKNALSGKMISKLTEILDELYDWPQGKGVLLYGFNGTFCSGSDLVSVRETANSQGGLELAQIMQYNIMRLQQLPMISVALIEGYALGGGAELATAADLRLMTTTAKIGFVHIRVGVCCGWGGGSRLVQLLGPSRALDLLSSGRLVSAEEAKQLGLSNGTLEISSNEQEREQEKSFRKSSHTGSIHEQAIEFLKLRTIGAKETYVALKSMLNSARSKPFEESLKVEAQMFASTWGKEAHIRALDGNLKHKQ